MAGLDIAGLNISGPVCESELGNMLRFCYVRPVKTQPTGTRVEKSFELTFTERNYLIAYLKYSGFT